MELRQLRVVGGVVGGATGGVTEAVAGVATRLAVGTTTNDRTYGRGVQMQDKIFNHKKGGRSLLDSFKAEIYYDGEEVYIVSFTLDWPNCAKDQSISLTYYITDKAKHVALNVHYIINFVSIGSLGHFYIKT